MAYHLDAAEFACYSANEYRKRSDLTMTFDDRADFRQGAHNLMSKVMSSDVRGCS